MYPCALCKTLHFCHCCFLSVSKAAFFSHKKSSLLRLSFSCFESCLFYVLKDLFFAVYFIFCFFPLLVAKDLLFFINLFYSIIIFLCVKAFFNHQFLFVTKTLLHIFISCVMQKERKVTRVGIRNANGKNSHVDDDSPERQKGHKETRN